MIPLRDDNPTTLPPVVTVSIIIACTLTFLWQITQGAMKVNLQTQENGNFFTETPVTFPFQTRATGCPTSTPMISPVTATGGSCNQAGCHDTATNRIHLP